MGNKYDICLIIPLIGITLAFGKMLVDVYRFKPKQFLNTFDQSDRTHGRCSKGKHDFAFMDATKEQKAEIYELITNRPLTSNWEWEFYNLGLNLKNKVCIRCFRRDNNIEDYIQRLKIDKQIEEEISGIGGNFLKDVND